MSTPKISYLKKSEKKRLAFLNSMKTSSKLRDFFELNPDYIDEAIKAGAIASSLDKNLFNNAYFICELSESKLREKGRIHSEIERRKKIVEGMDNIEKNYISESIILGYSEVREQTFLRRKITSNIRKLIEVEERNLEFKKHAISLNYTLKFYSTDFSNITRKKIFIPDTYKNNEYFKKIFIGMHKKALFRLSNINEIFYRVRNGNAFKYLGEIKSKPIKTERTIEDNKTNGGYVEWE